MFGTVARMKFKPGAYEKMQDLMKEFEQRQVKGFLLNAVYRSQSDPDEVWLIVGFEDEASYRRQRGGPQTDQDGPAVPAVACRPAGMARRRDRVDDPRGGPGLELDAPGCAHLRQ